MYKYKSFKDEQINFYDVFRWFFLATIIGLVSGLMVSGFIKLLTWGTTYSESISHYAAFRW